MQRVKKYLETIQFYSIMFAITKERFSVDTVRKMCLEDLRTVCDWPDLSMFTCPEMCMLCDWPDLAMFIFLGYQ